jgi:hypothetical protein
MIFMSTQGVKVDNDLAQKIRAARRTLATDGCVRSAGDFESVSIGRSDGEVLRDLVLTERAHTGVGLVSPTEVQRPQSQKRWLPTGRAKGRVSAT